MGKAKIFAILFFTALVALYGVCAIGGPVPGSGAAQEDWKKEFEDVCAKTQDAMIFSQEELTVLVQRCDALEPKIEKLDDTQKRVYLRRLRQCRGLFVYVLDSNKKEKK